MKPSVSYGLLDLRLMFARQPVLAMLLGALVFLTLWQVLSAAPATPRAIDPNMDPARILAAQRSFHNVLIPPASLPAAQQVVLDAAAARQLVVGRVDYAQEADSVSGLTLATMRLPVSGRYADIRAFIDNALAAQPAMSIRHLSLQRETSAETEFVVTATLSAQFLVGGALR